MVRKPAGKVDGFYKTPMMLTFWGKILNGKHGILGRIHSWIFQGVKFVDYQIFLCGGMRTVFSLRNTIQHSPPFKKIHGKSPLIQMLHKAAVSSSLKTCFVELHLHVSPGHLPSWKIGVNHKVMWISVFGEDSPCQFVYSWLLLVLPLRRAKKPLG